jgi:hypothetical protein
MAGHPLADHERRAAAVKKKKAASAKLSYFRFRAYDWREASILFSLIEPCLFKIVVSRAAEVSSQCSHCSEPMPPMVFPGELEVMIGCQDIDEEFLHLNMGMIPGAELMEKTLTRTEDPYRIGQ